MIRGRRRSKQINKERSTTEENAMTKGCALALCTKKRVGVKTVSLECKWTDYTNKLIGVECVL